MDSNDFIMNKIETIKENKSFGVLIEVGLGQPVYNELCMHPNTASKIVYYAKSPNSWDYNKYTYKHDKNVRAISPEVLNNIILDELRSNFIHSANNQAFTVTNNNIGNTNTKNTFILANTVQVANNDTTQTHGWFGMSYGSNIKFYHFTINSDMQNRKHVSDLIAKIGLDIIASENNSAKLENGYIDIILDEKFNQLKNETLQTIVNAKLSIHNIHNASVVFTPKNEMIRYNDYLRSVQNSKLCVFKGSFNPIHSEHIKTIESIRELKQIDNVLLSISIYNRDPNKQIDVTNLLKRIKILNELGYTVLIDSFGMYHNSYTSMIHNVDFKNIDLNYVMGSDIARRFLEDENVYDVETSKKQLKYDSPDIYVSYFNKKWNQCNFFYVSRIANDKINIHPKLENFNYIDIEYKDLSSTSIREHIANNNVDKLVNVVGEQLVGLYKKHKI